MEDFLLPISLLLLGSDSELSKLFFAIGDSMLMLFTLLLDIFSSKRLGDYASL